MTICREPGLKAYILYDKDCKCYLAFGNCAVTAAQNVVAGLGRPADDYEDFSVQDSFAIDDTKAFQIFFEHGFYSLNPLSKNERT